MHHSPSASPQRTLATTRAERIRIKMELISLNTAPDKRTIVAPTDFGECKMSKSPADKKATVIDPQVAARERQKQATEQRAFQDALEDDEVYECLQSLRAKEQESAKKPGRS